MTYVVVLEQVKQRTKEEQRTKTWLPAFPLIPSTDTHGRNQGSHSRSQALQQGRLGFVAGVMLYIKHSLQICTFKFISSFDSLESLWFQYNLRESQASESQSNVPMNMKCWTSKLLHAPSIRESVAISPVVSCFPTRFSMRHEKTMSTNLELGCLHLNDSAADGKTDSFTGPLAVAAWPCFLPKHPNIVGTSLAEVYGAPVKCLLILQGNKCSSKCFPPYSKSQVNVMRRKYPHPLSMLSSCTWVAQGPVLVCIGSNTELAKDSPRSK